jgi:hypothetical protein
MTSARSRSSSKSDLFASFIAGIYLFRFRMGKTTSTMR